MSHVNFTPDGKWAFATKRGEDTVAVLRVEGTKVTYTGRDVTVGVEPYGLDVFPSQGRRDVGEVGDPGVTPFRKEAKASQ